MVVRERAARLRSRRGAAVAALMLGLPMLAGCESTARQDPFFVRPNADAYVFDNGAFFRDRPLDETLRSSLQLTDYRVALERTGLLTQLQRPGPYTVFAIPNPLMESQQTRAGGHLLDDSNLPFLRRTLGFTIVPGKYTVATLRAMIAKQRGPVGLRTLYGDVLSVSLEPMTNQLLLGDSQGHSTRLWLSDMPQSNGVLYATQSILFPGVASTTGVPAMVPQPRRLPPAFPDPTLR